ncbi:hypothetical protein [Sphingobacterium rhinopitheci]|nr:hypothetical protein [Sphingobacterium rhinopitheci]MCI0922654.1 hypothetical protein [Sphingobacterium rhinopitheci]
MWIDLTLEQKVQILQQTGEARGLPAFVVEKDWWVCYLISSGLLPKA